MGVGVAVERSGFLLRLFVLKCVYKGLLVMDLATFSC